MPEITAVPDRFPRPAHPGNARYLIHKVAAARVDERGILRFTYEDGTGKLLPPGPFYPSLVNGEVPLATTELARSRLDQPDEVCYLVAYHSGAFPNGFPECLLTTLDDLPARYRTGSAG